MKLAVVDPIDARIKLKNPEWSTAIFLLSRYTEGEVRLPVTHASKTQTLISPHLLWRNTLRLSLIWGD